MNYFQFKLKCLIIKNPSSMIKMQLRSAKKLDQEDTLAHFKEEFKISDPDQLYFMGNSLGRLPIPAASRAREIVEQEWGVGLVTSYQKGWWDSPIRIGNKLCPLLGADEGQVLVCDTVSINLIKLLQTALKLRPKRTKIVTDQTNFPSDIYAMQGVINQYKQTHRLQIIGKQKEGFLPLLDQLEKAIDEDTAVVSLSHVAFKSGYIYQVAKLTKMAHDRGALVIWDLSHSVGIVPIQLKEWKVDFAVGCTYKYLNGGPGSSGFLYVRKDHLDVAGSDMQGWWGQHNPFHFQINYEPAHSIRKFLVGSQPITTNLTMEVSLDIVLKAGIKQIREKSIRMTQFAIGLMRQRLLPLRFKIGSPLEAQSRGGHVCLQHPEAYRISKALKLRRKVVCDFRAPDVLRFGFSPLYNNFCQIEQLVSRLEQVMKEKAYQQFSTEVAGVT